MAYYIKQGQSSIFKLIKVYENECEILKNIKNINKNKKEKIVKKMKQKEINEIVLSCQLQEDKEFVSLLNNYDITILDGKWLMQYMLKDIINYLKDKQKLLDLDEITILCNDLTDEVSYHIKSFADEYKKIRIVTNHIEKFKKIEEDLFKQNGISIIITNNKRKALSKSKLIINFDFVEEIINQYNIYENAVIINLNDKIKINKKRFCGLIINDYEVKIEEENIENKPEYFNLVDVIKKKNDFKLKEILEEKIYLCVMKQANYKRFEMIEKIIKESGIKIKNLYGSNSIID